MTVDSCGLACRREDFTHSDATCRPSTALNQSASVALSNLSARPQPGVVVGLSRFELLTPRLSSVCSNQLSYRPRRYRRRRFGSDLSKNRDCPGSLKTRQNVHRTTCRIPDRSLICPPSLSLALELRRDVSRKEVIQPQVLLQLPCYDFTPITDHTLSACLPCGLARRFLVQPAFVM